VEDLAPQVRLLNQEVARLGGVDGQRKKGVTNEIMGRVKVVASKQIVTVQMKTPSPRWCPAGCSKTQRRRLQKMRQKKMRREMEQDQWCAPHGQGQANLEREVFGEGTGQ
jgi:hypothetical protein